MGILLDWFGLEVVVTVDESVVAVGSDFLLRLLLFLMFCMGNDASSGVCE